MDEQQLKTMLKETFDTVSIGYDSKSLRFFQSSAQHMAVLLGLQGNENVLDVRNVEFMERDMQNLNFPDGLFDVAVCAFGIFFVEDMESQLSHIAYAVKPGGRIMISNF